MHIPLASPASPPEIEPVIGEITRYWVKSHTQPGITHLVDLDYEGAPACSCQDHQCRGNKCKHIRAVQRILTLSAVP